MTGNLQSSLLVTGAGGHLGRRVVKLLLAAGAKHLVAGTRDPAKINELFGLGAETRRMDFEDPSTLEAAYRGIQRVLIISTDAIFVPGQRLKQHCAAVDAAVRAGVEHIVYTSMPNPEPPSVMPIAPDHYGTEQRIVQSGTSFTILRDSWYSENLIRSLPQVMASGRWYTSAGDGRMNYVTRDDVARAAATALSSDMPGGNRYDITGPQSLTTVEIASIAGKVFDKSIEVVQVADEDLSRILTAAGLPAAWVPRRIATDANMRAGKFDIVSDAVTRLTGKPPQSLYDFFIANAAAFAAAA